MTKKKKSDLTAFLLGATIGGFAGSIVLERIFTADQENYAGQQENIAYPTEEQKEPICDKAIAPLRADFSKSCTLENFDSGDVLETIAQRRDEILRKYGCEEQAWECKPKYSTNLDRRFEAEFRYK